MCYQIFDILKSHLTQVAELDRLLLKSLALSSNCDIDEDKRQLQQAARISTSCTRSTREIFTLARINPRISLSDVIDLSSIETFSDLETILIDRKVSNYHGSRA